MLSVKWVIMFQMNQHRNTYYTNRAIVWKLWLTTDTQHFHVEILKSGTSTMPACHISSLQLKYFGSFVKVSTTIQLPSRFMTFSEQSCSWWQLPKPQIETISLHSLIYCVIFSAGNISFMCLHYSERCFSPYRIEEVLLLATEQHLWAGSGH